MSVYGLRVINGLIRSIKCYSVNILELGVS